MKHLHWHIPELTPMTKQEKQTQTTQKFTRIFKGMRYRELQIANSQNRKSLSKDDQQWLKNAGYKNTGWESVIKLYEKIASLQRALEMIEEMSLGDMFLEADRIGNKYQTADEIADYQQKLAEADLLINEQIDQHFVDTEVEVIDFDAGKLSKVSKPRAKKVR